MMELNRKMEDKITKNCFTLFRLNLNSLQLYELVFKKSNYLE